MVPFTTPDIEERRQEAMKRHLESLTPLIEADFDFEFGPYRLQPYQRVHKRDPESLDPYGPQNHPLPPFVPSDERTVKGVGQ